jgi:hypothetical protein
MTRLAFYRTPFFCFVCAIFLLPLIGMISAGAVNRIEIDAAKSGTAPVHYDTLYVGGEYELRYWVENDVVIGGISSPIQIWSDDGAEWEYISRPWGIGTNKFFTIVPGSRLDGFPFDMTGVFVTEYNIDTQNRDTLAWGGFALNNGLQTGPLEHMISLNFRPVGPWIPGEIHTLCFDTCLVAPGPIWVWVDIIGNAAIPEWGGQLCLPVKLICGNPNGDNDVNVGDAVFMINYVFREGTAPDPWQLGDANCDGELNVGDIVFLIAAIFRDGPQPQCCE